MCDVPEPFKGAAITMIVAGILALGFMGFTGVDSGLRKAITPAAESQAILEENQPPKMVAHWLGDRHIG